MQNQQNQTSESGFRRKINRESDLRKWTSMQNQQNRTSENVFRRKINRIRHHKMDFVANQKLILENAITLHYLQNN